MKLFFDKIKELLQLNKIELPDEKTILVDLYIQLLLEKNKAINLISRKDTENVLENHILPCLIFSSYLTNFDKNFLDIGTGGGLPGILFAILHQNAKGILVDSTQKKINAVEFFIAQMKLSNIKTLHTRVESNNFIEKYKNYFELVISRGTADLKTLIKYSYPLLKKDHPSYLLLMKGGDLEKEIDSAKKDYKKIKVSTLAMPYIPGNENNINKKYIIKVENIF